MKSTQRIALILAFVFLLPALFFSVYEISSLNKDEEMIQNIYTKQLEAILFSVNQYSDDVLNSWTTKIQGSLEETDTKRLDELLSLNTSLTRIFTADTVPETGVQNIFELKDSSRSNSKSGIDSVLARGSVKIKQLLSYKKNGFQKIDWLPYSQNPNENTQCLVFIAQAKQKMLVVGLLIDAELFIQDLVGPRLQAVAKDQFILSVFRKNQSAPIYSTLQADTTSAKTEALTKDFWLFPDYALGIRTQGTSLQALIRERTTTNLVLLLALDVVLIIAVILVFRNVKKEVQLAQNKADFVSNVSHEIRTPLALISMFAETLEMGRVKSEEKKQEYYGIISKETHRLSGIVNKILNFSQTEANKKKLDIRSIHLGNEVKEILATYDFHLRNKGFTHTFSENSTVWVDADKEAVVESVINLIDNAIKYSSAEKKIEISIDIENGFGTVAVKDHGVGISKMDQKHIFDKFYRVSSGNLAKSTGTGLGLSLVKQLMEAQKGKITVDSTEGKGSLFTLYFPLTAKN